MKNNWLDKYLDDVSKAQNGIEGTMGGLTDKGFNYNGAWGGQFQMGGSVYPVNYIPEAQNGFFETLKTNLNPYNWGVEDYSEEKDFDKAYSKAKKSGEEEFMYKNKRYNTKYAGTPRQEVGTYGIKGNPVNDKYPIQVNKYDAFGEEYLPGHLSAGIVGRNPNLSPKTSVNKTSKGGNNKKDSKPDQALYVYNANLKPKNVKPGYNLITNNCADAVCDALSLNDRTLIETPPGVVKKLLSSEQYPSLDVTGRTYRDYRESLLYEKNILDNSKYWLGIASSPDNKKLSNAIVSEIQNALSKKGYQLPKSTKKTDMVDYYGSEGFDGIYGEETKQALLDYQSKNKYQMGGSIPGSVGFTYARTKGIPSEGKYAKKTLPSAQDGFSERAQGLTKRDNLNTILSKKVQQEENKKYKKKSFNLPVQPMLSQDTTIPEEAKKRKEAFDKVARPSGSQLLMEGVSTLPLMYLSNPIKGIGHLLQDTPIGEQLGNFNPDLEAVRTLRYRPGTERQKEEDRKSLSSMENQYATNAFINAGLLELGYLSPNLSIPQHLLKSGSMSNLIADGLQTQSSLSEQNYGDAAMNILSMSSKLDNFDASNARKLIFNPSSLNRADKVDALKDITNLGFAVQQQTQRTEPVQQIPKQEDGGVIKDDNGYWNPDNWGSPVEINSNNITMKGVYEPLLGISDTGDTKLMQPGKDYKFKGKKVTEYPLAKDGKELVKLNQLTNFTNYNTKQPGGWMDKYQ